MTKEFAFLGESPQRRAITLSILAIAEAVLVALLFNILRIDIKDGLPEYLLITGLLILFMIWLNTYTHKKMKKQKIEISGAGMIFSGLGDVENIDYRDIRKITVIRNRMKESVQIVLRTDNKKFRIYRFENMDDILEMLKENILSETDLIEFNSNIIWKKPIALIVIIMTLVFVAMLAIKFELIRYILLLAFTLFGFYFGLAIMRGKAVIFRTGNKLEKLNKVYGFFILALSCLGMISSGLLVFYKIHIE